MTRVAGVPRGNGRLPRQTESAFQASVVKIARDLGWGITSKAQQKLAEEAAGWGAKVPELDGLIFHPRIMYRSEPGWPDLTLVRRRDRRLVFAELKAEDGKLTTRQVEVLDLLRMLAHGNERPHPDFTWIQVWVWRPSDLAQIHGILA